MAVFAAFRDGWTALVDNPALLAAGLVVGAASQRSTLAEVTGIGVDSGLAVLVWFFAFPFAMVGFLGMALGAVRDSETSFGAFVRSGRAYYVRMLAATILLVAVVVGILVATMPLSVAPAALVVLAGLGQTAWFAALAVAVGASLLTVPAILASIFFLQFYGTAIVVEDESVRGAFVRSARVVRHNLASVVGFSLVWGILLTSVTAPEYLLQVLPPVSQLSEPLGIELTVPARTLLPAIILLAGVAFTYLYTVYTAYYVRLVAATPGGTVRLSSG